MILLVAAACVPELGPLAPPPDGTTDPVGGAPLELGHAEWAVVTWFSADRDVGLGMDMTTLGPLVPGGSNAVLAVVGPGGCGSMVGGESCAGQLEHVFRLRSSALQAEDGSWPALVSSDTSNAPLSLMSRGIPTVGGHRSGKLITYAPTADEDRLLLGNSQGAEGAGLVRDIEVCAPETGGGDTGDTGAVDDDHCPFNDRWLSGIEGETLGWAVAELGGQVVGGAPAVDGATAGQVYVIPRFVAEEGVDWTDPATVVFGWADPSQPVRLGTALATTDFTCTEPSCATTDLVVSAPAAAAGRGSVHLIGDALGHEGTATIQAAADLTLVGGTAGPHALGVALHVADIDAAAGPDLWIADNRDWLLVSSEFLTDPTNQGPRPHVAQQAADLILQGDLGWADGPDAEGRLTCDGITHGDVDGDGAVDLLLGGCSAPDGFGRVYLIRGPLGRGGLQGTHRIDEVASVVLRGHSPHDYTGSSLALIRNAQRDPQGTILAVGAWGFDTAADDRRGALFLTSPGLLAELLP